MYLCVYVWVDYEYFEYQSSTNKNGNLYMN